MNVKPKIITLLASLNEGIYEKEEAVRLALLAAVAGESIFLLGPPGVAKSLIARRLKYAFKDGGAFEYLMSRFSTPDEIFGPVSIKKLKDEDKYERITAGYLPSASVVFLDEIWKAGPSIQNALLTALNEKIYRNGSAEIALPLKALISASNELPAKGEGLEALWDRFLVRLVVNGIEAKPEFDKMITMESKGAFEIPNEDKITNEEYENWRVEIDKIIIPENVLKVIHAIRAYIQEHNEKCENEENAEDKIYVSDRRWRKITRLLCACAFLNGRTEVDLMDCFIIRHCIWNEEPQQPIAFNFVSEAVGAHGYTVNIDLINIEKELGAIDNDVKEWTKGEKDVKYNVPKLNKNKNGNKLYYKIDVTDDSNYNILLENEYKKLQINRFVECKVYSSNMYNNHTAWLKLSSDGLEVSISEEENSKECDVCSFECETKTRKEYFPYINPAHHGTIKEWDKRINVVKTKIGNMTAQIERFRSNELKDIHTNIFGNDTYINIIESDLNDIQKNIDNLKIESDRIHHAYHNIESSQDLNSQKLLNNE